MLHLQVILKFILLQVLLGSCQILSYDLLNETGKSCFPKDTCRVPRDLDNPSDHNCDCGSLCTLYHTCCIDSPFLNHSKSYPKSSSCTFVPGEKNGVFMVDSCPEGWTGQSDIRSMCEHVAKDWKDPLLKTPVTNPKAQKTYKSLFCAICNGERSRDLKFWTIQMDCSGLEDSVKLCEYRRDFVLRNMIYIQDKEMWGLWSWSHKNDWMFRFLPISFLVPLEIRHVVKHCRLDLISECARDWTDGQVQKLCKSYMSSVYWPQKAFRNIHCAICNRVTNSTGFSCHDVDNSYFRTPPLSFGLLLDLDTGDGDSVGTINRCPENHVYDPFSKKCRGIKCPLPGTKLQGSKCVPT